MARTTADAAAFWRRQPLTRALLDEYTASMAAPHRGWALAALDELAPFETVLELGCHCGPLLTQIAARRGVKAFGLDVNAEAIVAAQARGLQAGVGEVPDCLLLCPDAGFDVVITSYCLAYIAPADLPRTLGQMIRVAREGVVIVEPMAGPGVAVAVGVDERYVEWKHDYLDAMDTALRFYRPTGVIHVALTRVARGPYAGINGVVVGRIAREHL